MKESKLINDLFDRLFPICRSIAGPGLRESLGILSEEMPLEIHSVPTGTKVFDWIVPQEWHISKAYLTGPDGKRYADFKRSNLSVVSHSAPVDMKIPLQTLQRHLYSIPELPEAIPYVTSFYKKRWGFCLPYNVRQALPQGTYHAFIDAKLTNGQLNFGEAVIPGETDKEILLSTNLCHPSLANNELSGPLIAALLYRRIKAWKKRRYTYRFYIGPETIGCIAYLSLRGNQLKENLVSGIVLTSLGGDDPGLNFKMARNGRSLINLVIDYLIKREKRPLTVLPFTPVRGSDERHYCSPGFDLPVGQFTKTHHSHYKGYHNSLDTKEAMGIENLIYSAKAIEEVLRYTEYGGYFYNQLPYGEVQLGKRNLYPTLNHPAFNYPVHNPDSKMKKRPAKNNNEKTKMSDCILMILNYCDGDHTMMEIADMCGMPLGKLLPTIDRLEEEKLLSLKEPVCGEE